jgi:hypothetical protein
VDDQLHLPEVVEGIDRNWAAIRGCELGYQSIAMVPRSRGD